MFEDSLVESQNRLSSPNQRWTTVASLALQCALAATIASLSLLHPDVLPFRSNSATVTLPPKPIPRPIPQLEPHRAISASLGAATVRAFGMQLPDIRRVPSFNARVADDPPAAANIGSMTGSTDIPGGIANGAEGARARVTATAQTPAGPVRISRGVSAGLLLAPIRPLYPPLAVTTRTEGLVVIEAIISASGNIESARATSGPALLRDAALQAVRKARYSPFLLNGLPTQVETTITIMFKLAD